MRETMASAHLSEFLLLVLKLDSSHLKRCCSRSMSPACGPPKAADGASSGWQEHNTIRIFGEWGG